MTIDASINSAQKKIDTHKSKTKKARSRLRQLQRQQQSKHLEEIGILVQSSLQKSLTADDKQALVEVLSLAADTQLTLIEVLGALVIVKRTLNGPEPGHTRPNLLSSAKSYLAVAP